MTFRRSRRRCGALLVSLALVFGLAPLARGADRDAVPPSNAQLLLGVSRAVARRLVAQAPLTPGSRVGLRPEPGQGIESDVLDALVMALNERRIECVILEAPPAGAPGETTGTAQTDTTVKTGSMANLGAFAQLQAERAAQAARADSIARAGGTGTPAPASSPSVMANGGAAASLAVLNYRVPEARVDYVRIFRGGLFGAERVERRASARVALRLLGPNSDAVRWSATADTTVSDVVMKSEIASLEDRTRPETRSIAPTSSLKRLVEPALVVVLVAGLVSLFYQNRP
jgi:hypothetical protein